MAIVRPESPADGIPRRYLSIEAESFADLAESIERPEGTFAVFLACDASGIPNAELAAFSRRLIDKGIAYLLAWGPDCDRVHVRFDLASVDHDLETGKGQHVMTSSHEEDLDEAFYFFLFNTFPDDYEMICRTGIAASVANPNWARAIRSRLSDVGALKAAVGLAPS